MHAFASLSEQCNRIRDHLNAREREWERVHCILRKKDARRLHVRPSGQKSATPLFREQASKTIKHLYLPEERDDPLRHMRDPRHFSHLQKIGAGAFGSICLVENRITGKKMAMKSLRRKDNTSEEINLEIRALLRAQESGWFPKLLSTFMDPVNFYILMPFYPLGDLYTVMTSSGGCLSRELCRFYLAELILALQCLHKIGIIHRDIKPDNILFEETGHLVVADLGVAHVFIEDEEDATFMADEYPLWEEMKFINDDGFPLLTPSIDNPHTIKGVAGTPFYAAPEVLEGRQYSYGVDYYSLAIVYHEMVTGYVPIQCGPCLPGQSEPTITLDLGRKDVHFQPLSVSDYDFLSQMLDEDCYARPSVKQMKNHPVLAGM
uniref:non-specific serine/threonine protein kinase n=1 Tax=Psilocybe cubensis TaxID=181762 RepID=A0A8H8CF56_PSICU